MMLDKTAIRNASTIIVVRDRHENPSVLMGQRGANAAFMPNKFVFPGGAMDQADRTVPLASNIPAPCDNRLIEDSAEDLRVGLVAAAVRELWEETGLILGSPGSWGTPPPADWQDFANAGYLPSGQHLQFVFRAITPPGRPRRFDARFFLADAAHIQNDLDDFSRACDELSHLQWIPLTKARSYDLPFITEVVLAEVAATITNDAPPPSVPFFNNDDEASLFLRLHGKQLPD
ncbi:MAG: NUDIX hydrolase [Paracoccaceae bacterium]|nr:NUDIX hydrolase [Paracoccaceae bacterium]